METKPQKINHTAGIIGLIVTVILIIVLWRGCSSEKEKPMGVSVNLGESSLTIINASGNSYTNVVVKVNGDYRFKVGDLGSSETREIQFESFETSDGTRFNKDETGVVDVYLSGYYLGNKHWDFFKPRK